MTHMADMEPAGRADTIYGRAPSRTSTMAHLADTGPHERAPTETGRHAGVRVAVPHRADINLAGQAARETASNGSSSRWAYWALPLAALAGVGWFLMSGEEPSRQAADAPPTLAGVDSRRTTPNLVVGGVDLGRHTVTVIESLRTSLEGVTDHGSAAAAQPKLQAAAEDLDRLAKLSRKLPEAGRVALASLTSGPLTALDTALDRANAIPGVASLLQPTVDQLRGRLDVIAMAAPSGGQMFLTKVPADWVAISTYRNREVYNAAGEGLGTVNELFIGPDGKLAAAVVGVGRHLGLGEREVAIPFAASRIVRKDGGWHFVIDATKETLKAAPSFERGK